MIVTNENIRDILSSLGERCATDVETTGLSPYKTDELFSIIISNEQHDYYFNFKDYGDGSPFLPRTALKLIGDELGSKPRIWFLQNAKFDMAFLAKEGLFLNGTIFDLGVLDRLHRNQHMSYRLKDIAKRWGFEKLDIVEEWMDKNKKTAVSDHICPVSGKEYTLKDYSKVPFNIISEYGEFDGNATYGSSVKVLHALKSEDSMMPGSSTLKLVNTEAQLTRTLFDMERVGVQVDIPYCKEALSFFRAQQSRLEATFKSLTGLEYKKGTTVFEEVFKDEQKQGKWKKTESGNWRFDKAILESFTHPAARTAIDLAEAKKQIDYFANILFYADSNSVLHPNFRAGGTVTGRLSSSDPNFQNLTNPDKYDEDSAASLFPVRKAFVPRDGYIFAMIDYVASEMRIFLDYSNPQELVAKVLAGHDVHQATADVAGVTRKEAKTVNFLSLYGGGVSKLVSNLYKPMGSQDQVASLFKHINGWRFRDENERTAFLSCSEEMKAHDTPLIEKAYGIQQSIFRAAPEMKATIKSMQQKAEDRGFVVNKYGRRLYFPDKRFAFRACNHIIQSTGADMIKLAMNAVAEYLSDKKSRLLLSIHDELCLEVSLDEIGFVPQEVGRIMASAYIPKRIPQDTSIEYGLKNMAEKTETL